MATGGLNLYDALTKKLPEVITKRYRDLPFENGTIVPTVTDLQPGDAELSRDLLEEVGDAEIVGDDTTNFPIVDLSAEEDRYKILMVANGFSFTYNQIAAYERAGNFQQVNNRKMMVARRGIAERMNKLAAFGNAGQGITGFLNNPNVPLDNSSFDPWDANTTGDDLSDWVQEQVEVAYTANNNSYMPSELLCSTEFWFLLNRKRMSDSGEKVINHLTQGENPPLRRIVWSSETRSSALEANGVQAANTDLDRLVLYPLDEMVVDRHNSTVGLLPPDYIQTKGTRKIYPMFGLTSPTMINIPYAMRYITVAKKP